MAVVIPFLSKMNMVVFQILTTHTLVEVGVMLTVILPALMLLKILKKVEPRNT